MNIQFEVQKIHSQFGTTEMANYQIQKLFDKLILEDRAEQLRKHAVINSVCPFCNSKETEDNQPTRHCRYCNQDYGQTDI